MKLYENYIYEEYPDRKAAGIVRYEGDEDTVVIPAEINGLRVTSIQQQAFVGKDLVELIVPEGVETIETEAFALCECLQKVTLPESLKALGRGVFKGSEALREITVPDESESFFVQNGILYNIQERSLVLCPPGLKREMVTVPEGTKKISAAAFYCNNLLKSVKLPGTLKKIESEAFLFTRELHRIELPPGIEEIEPDCFLLVHGIPAEKPFMIFATMDTAGYRYAVENKILVQPIPGKIPDWMEKLYDRKDPS